MNRKQSWQRINHDYNEIASFHSNPHKQVSCPRNSLIFKMSATHGSPDNSEVFVNY